MSGADFGLAAFIESLAWLPRLDERPFFAPGRSISVARAPGRLDVMGGVADYSGSLVLEMPIHDGAFAAVQLHSEPDVHVLSLGHGGGMSRVFRTEMTQLLSYSEEEKLFAPASNRWAGYILGAFRVLARKRGVRFANGARICIGSTVPEGRGLASSAAIEVSAMSAIADAYGLDASAREIALLCHLLENEVVGVPCGPMDQFAVTLGEDSRLLALLCRPAQELASVDFPDGVVAVGVDSGASHSNADGAYRRARTAAFMGKHILEQHHGRLEYLTELDPNELRVQRARLPRAISGADYIRRHGLLEDSSALIEPGVTYPVRGAARHAVEEHQRVQEFAGLLPHARSRSELERLGSLMNLSHQGYSACGLGSKATDDLAEELRRVPGVYGARVSGGGCGGTVAVLLAAEAVALVTEAVQGLGPRLFSGSSPGAHQFGFRRVLLQR